MSVASVRFQVHPTGYAACLLAEVELGVDMAIAAGPWRAEARET